jgi:hypothetical protein
MKLTFFEADTPLTKSFSLDRTGALIKQPYPMVKNFTTHHEDVKTLSEMHKQLQSHAALGHCVCKGLVKRDLKSEPRAGATVTNDSTEWIVLDADGLPASIPDVPTLLTLLGLERCSHVVQWSASYGIENTDLRAHVFIQLDKPYPAPTIKQWLIHKNLTIPELKAAVSLTRTGMALRWPLDISACQNDKLIYIAPPKLGKGVKDPMPSTTARIAFHKGKVDTFKFSTVNSIQFSQNEKLKADLINDLRTQAGLTKRKVATKFHGTTEVMVKADAVGAYETKEDRGFVYFNLNGGDSWGYYHPEGKPDFIYNFKGEPAYLTKELLPEYFAEATQQLADAKAAAQTTPSIDLDTNSPVVPVAFLDPNTNTYYRGRYTKATMELDIKPTNSVRIVEDFCRAQGFDADIIPEWSLNFDPTVDPRKVEPYDAANKIINVFRPTALLQQSLDAKIPKTIPKTILHVINHALGTSTSEEETATDLLAHFINWLACVFQYRVAPQTAWVLHGTTGTGKGTLMNKILRPLFGDHMTKCSMDELGERYTEYMHNSLLVHVDEADMKVVLSERGVMAKLREFITEAIIRNRKFGKGYFNLQNHTAWIFTSNKKDPVQIDPDDRRFNVGDEQRSKLNFDHLNMTMDEALEQIEKELPAFAAYLMHCPCDRQQARTVMQTAARKHMQDMSISTGDRIADALIKGDMEFFLRLMDREAPKTALRANKLNAYRDLMHTLLLRGVARTGQGAIRIPEMRTIFEYLAGSTSEGELHFYQYLGHRGIKIRSVRAAQPGQANAPVADGTLVPWQNSQKFGTWLGEFFPPVAAPAAKTTKPKAKATLKVVAGTAVAKKTASRKKA